CALFHAGPRLTAGVYLVARCNLLFAMAPVSSAVVAGVGALTALFAATIALKQWDIKRVLAYSTISQLGYMFLAVGTGAISAGIFHLATHAFFKALLFLGSGSVIYAMHHAYHATHSHEDAQDMRNMSGLSRYMPWTTVLMWTATLAIAGIPVLSGGGEWPDDSVETVVHPGAALGPEAQLSSATEWMLVGIAVATAIVGIVGAWRLLRPQDLVPARSAPEERGFARVLRNKWDI